MKIYNVVEIHDYGFHVTLVTMSGVVIHLPEGEHNITIHEMNDPGDKYIFNVGIDLYSG